MTFSATDAAGLPVYHTNVMMAIGTDFAVVCLESVADDKERKHLLSRLSEHHQVPVADLSTCSACIASQPLPLWRQWSAVAQGCHQLGMCMPAVASVSPAQLCAISILREDRVWVRPSMHGGYHNPASEVLHVQRAPCLVDAQRTMRATARLLPVAVRFAQTTRCACLSIPGV